jgi:hypothetical protein
MFHETSFHDLPFHEQRAAQRAKARTYTDLEKDPTLTDQSQANDTNINVIVKRYGVHAQAPGGSTPPIYGDFTGLPTDLRGMIETARTINEQRERLPKALQDMPIEELLSLTNEQLTTILTPPAKTPADQENQK